MVCNISVLLHFLPVLAPLAFAVRLLPHHFSYLSGCPVLWAVSSWGFSELSSFPLSFSLPSAPFCCLDFLGWVLNPLPLSTVALTLHLSFLNLCTHPSPKAGLLQSFLQLVKKELWVSPDLLYFGGHVWSQRYSVISPSSQQRSLRMWHFKTVRWHLRVNVGC